MIRANLPADARGRILCARLRGGSSDAAIANFLQTVAWEREERHHFGVADFIAHEGSPSCISG
jgi:hypothetical protein